MKNILFASMIITLSFSAFAKLPSLSKCDKDGYDYLENSKKRMAEDGYQFSKYIKNEQGETVGIYIWDSRSVGLYAEVCDNIYSNDEITASSKWYYTEVNNTNPKTWKHGSLVDLYQDEGLAQMTVVRTSKNGDVVVRFTVKGWDASGSEISLRESVVHFSN